MPSSFPLRYHLAMVLHTLLIGPSYTLVHWGAAEFQPTALLFFRMLFTAAIFAGLFLARGGFRGSYPTRLQWRNLLLLALFGAALNQLLFVTGMKYSTATNGALIYATTPLIVLLGASQLTKTEALTPGKLLGVLLALGGVLLVFIALGRELRFDAILGNVILVGAVTCWAGYVLYGKSVLAPFDPLQATAIVMVMAFLLYAPFGATQLASVEYATLSWKAWAGLGSLVLINSTANYLLVTYSLGGLQSSQVAIYMNLQPVTAAAFSVLILGEEQLTLLFVIGGLTTIAGLYLLNRARLRMARQLAAEKVGK